VQVQEKVHMEKLYILGLTLEHELNLPCYYLPLIIYFRKIFQKFMLKILVFAFIAIFFSSCSSQKEIVKDKSGRDTLSFSNFSGNKKNAALEHFINGSIAESKGDYASAILEFQDALSLDTSAGIYYALAKNYFFLNKLSLALLNSRKSIELDPSNVEYFEMLADIFSSAREFDSSAAVLEKIIAKDSAKVNSYYKLARIYENTKPLKAISVYNKLTDIIGPDWNVLIRVAEIHEKLGNLDEAAAAVERLLSIDPSNTAIQKLLSEFYQKGKKYDKALEVLNDILDFVPDDLDARERKAQIFLSGNNWEAAAKEYNYILEQPNIPLDIKLRIGASYFNRSLTDSTLLPITKEFFEKINRDTLDWQVKMYLGAIAINEKNDSTAIENFKIVTELAKWNVDAWVRLGGLYFDNRRYDEAAKIMNEAIESFPDDFAVNLILGLSLAQCDKHSNAREYLKKAVELNPSDITALSAYAYTLNELKESDAAIEYLKKALEIKPDDVNLLGTLGLIYNAQERWLECDSVYQKALEQDSLNPTINNNYAYSLSERGIKLDEALEMAKIAIEKEPANSSFLDTIGWVYFKLGNYSQAKDYLEKAIDKGGERAVMLEHLGDVVYMIGDKEQAKQLWQKAYNLDSNNTSLKNKLEKGEI